MADGQCALIVEQGKIVEVCAEPGEYTYDASTEPTIFSGNLGSSLDQVFDVIGNVLHMEETPEKIRESTI